MHQLTFFEFVYRYHSWEHYSSVRNIDGPSQGPPEIKDRVMWNMNIVRL